MRRGGRSPSSTTEVSSTIWPPTSASPTRPDRVILPGATGAPLPAPGFPSVSFTSSSLPPSSGSAFAVWPAKRWSTISTTAAGPSSSRTSTPASPPQAQSTASCPNAPPSSATVSFGASSRAHFMAAHAGSAPGTGWAAKRSSMKAPSTGPPPATVTASPPPASSLASALPPVTRPATSTASASSATRRASSRPSKGASSKA